MKWVQELLDLRRKWSGIIQLQQNKDDESAHARIGAPMTRHIDRQHPRRRIEQLRRAPLRTRPMIKPDTANATMVVVKFNDNPGMPQSKAEIEILQ